MVYGVENLKTHCKLCLVVRKESDGVRRYVHIGTGNYNATTAQIYTDLGLFTADPEIGDDVQDVFNYLTGYSKRKEYRQLLIAPVSLRGRFMALLDREIDHARNGRPAHVIAKNNAVTDPAMIRALYRAAQAGVEIDLIIRGACCLKPGIARRQRAHSRAIGRRPVPRALPRLLVCQRRSAGGLHRQRRPHGTKPRPAGGSAVPRA